jgi:chromosome segregation protein
VRWVLGESKASALRGESMQDVIFNGAGERKAVGRASVELMFDNSAGRIGGQWGRYAELSIKRVLTRDEDSSYYINNIPVRRRDIYDLFLGTGLGPRAYAIIEQGMISRVIEAKPRSCASSSRKRRRLQVQGAAQGNGSATRRDPQEPCPRRGHPDRARRPAGEARRAGEGRDRIPGARARLSSSSISSGISKQQDAAHARERHSNAVRASDRGVREPAGGRARRRGEARGAAHRALCAGDAPARAAGRVYEANAEVTRLEQQLAIRRESETRITQQVAQLTEQIGALAGQETALLADRASSSRRSKTHSRQRERTGEAERAATAALPEREHAVAPRRRLPRAAAADRPGRAVDPRHREPPRERRGADRAARAAPRSDCRRSRCARAAGHEPDCGSRRSS